MTKCSNLVQDSPIDRQLVTVLESGEMCSDLGVLSIDLAVAF